VKKTGIVVVTLVGMYMLITAYMLYEDLSFGNSEIRAVTPARGKPAGFEYIEAPEGFDWRQFEGITLDFVVENNINANILTREIGEFINATGININIRPMDYCTFIEKMSIDFISRTAKYELIYVDPYQTLNRFYNRLEDLNLFNNDETLPKLAGWPGDFYQNQVDVVSYFLDRRRLYAIPFDSTTMILFYRKDIFDKYRTAFFDDKGYDWTPGTPDFTWERYIEIAAWIDANVPDSEVRYGSGHMAQHHNSIYTDFSNVMAAYGADFFYDMNAGSLGVKNLEQIGVGSNAFIKALSVYKEVIRTASPDSLNWDWVDSAEAFKQGEIAMMPNWDEYWATIENEALSKVAGQVGWSVLPYGEVRSANIYGGSGIGINKDAPEEKKRAAWLFIVWFSSEHIQTLILNAPGGGNIPPRKSISENPDIISNTTAMHMPIVLSAWSPDKAYFRPKAKNFYSIENIIIDNLHKMLRYDYDPSEIAHQMYLELSQLP